MRCYASRKVIDEPVEGRRSAESRARAAQLYGTAQYEAFVDSLRSRADVEVNPANLEKK